MLESVYLFSKQFYMYDILNNSAFIVALVYVILNNIIYGCQRGLVCEKIISSKYILRKNTEVGRFTFLKNRKFISFVEYILLTYILILPLTFMNDIFGEIFTNGTANYFGSLFTYPLIFFPAAVIIGINPVEYFDRLAPVYPLTLIPIKLACFCAGCCSGVESRFGLYFPTEEKVLFPVQLVEAGCALIIFLILNKYRHKAKKGTVFPLFVILYSSTRFISEFWRSEENVFGILKTYHILCLVGIAVGLGELAAAIIFGDRLSAFFERLLGGYGQFLDNYVFVSRYQAEHLRTKRRKRREKEKAKKKNYARYKS